MSNSRGLIVEITKKEESGVVSLVINGRLDAVTASDAEQAINEITKEQGVRLLFDLEPLEYISSAGVRSILQAESGTESGSDEHRNPSIDD